MEETQKQLHDYQNRLASQKQSPPATPMAHVPLADNPNFVSREELEHQLSELESAYEAKLQHAQVRRCEIAHMRMHMHMHMCIDMHAHIKTHACTHHLSNGANGEIATAI